MAAYERQPTSASQQPQPEMRPALQLLLEKLGSEALSAMELMQRMGLKNRPLVFEAIFTSGT